MGDWVGEGGFWSESLDDGPSEGCWLAPRSLRSSCLTLEWLGVAEKDCSNGFGSSAKSERVCLRTVGRGAGLRPLFS